VDEGTSMNLDQRTTYLELQMQVVSSWKCVKVNRSFLCQRRQTSGRECEHL